MTVHDTQNPESREDALAAAVDAVRGGGLIVLPTDTVYGIGADAFTPDAVEALLEAKGRGRDTPPPVLIGDQAVLLALAADIPDYVEDLTEELWPGALTLILTAQRSLTWDLGETRGTVALRMPDDEIALELLRRTGPLAVSSANRHGKPAALSILEAATQLGDAVEIYLDGGPARIGESSTIVDTTVTPAEIVREGAITKERIIEVVGDIFTAPEPEPADDETGEGEPADGEISLDETADGETGGGETGGGETGGGETGGGETGDAGSSDAENSDGSTPVAPGSADSPAADPVPAAATPADSTSSDPAASDDPGSDPSGSDDDDPGSDTAAPAASTSVLDLPTEPASSTTAAGTRGAPAETPLDSVGEQAPATTSESASGEGGSERTPG